jgi:lipopolysaccharide/colanic/teichoic acid biosynthesis glycosyltransferase
VRRLVDILVAAVALIVLSPLLAVTTLAIWANLGSPIVFRQTRPGLQGKPFTLYKFRTMSDTHGKDGSLLPDSERLTGLGRFLRAWSIDELPELWNVVRGDMGLIGPRPLLTEYLPLYTPQQARRHEVRPGLTGWAQVKGRNAISWEEKFALDVWYVDHRNIWLDLKILWLTVKNVLKRHGISAEGDATMPRFTGTRSE